MIEFDVDMGYLLEAGELDCFVLNDENGEHESMEFVPKLGSWTCQDKSVNPLRFECSECGGVSLEIAPNFCPICGEKVNR